eukprot:1673570-Pyramimonas_sp.AAC.3
METLRSEMRGLDISKKLEKCPLRNVLRSSSGAVLRGRLPAGESGGRAGGGGGLGGVVPVEGAVHEGAMDAFGFLAGEHRSLLAEVVPTQRPVSAP